MKGISFPRMNKPIHKGIPLFLPPPFRAKGGEFYFPRNLKIILKLLDKPPGGCYNENRLISAAKEEYRMAQLTCQNLSLGYEGREIVSGLNFEVNEGEYLCIVGENGSGKTTLMKTILGLLPPLGGKILHGDGLKPNEIGYLPQQTAVQKDFPASVYEIVLSGFAGSMGLRPFYNKEEKMRAAEAMEKMGLTQLAERCYRELSGGQQQRVLLARALCATKKMILLDEPVSGLDPKVTAEMYALIEHLNREDGITIIMISHDVGAALASASHVLHIGSTIYFGTKDEYRESADETLPKGGEA